MLWHPPLFDPTDVERICFRESFAAPHGNYFSEYEAFLEWQGDFVGTATGARDYDREVELTWPVQISEIFSTTCLQALAKIPMHPLDYRPPDPGPMPFCSDTKLEIVTSTDTLTFEVSSRQGWYVQRDETYCFCRAQKLVSDVMYTIEATLNTEQHVDELDAAWEESQPRRNAPKHKTQRIIR
jgi:hypothetical protein